MDKNSYKKRALFTLSSEAEALKGLSKMAHGSAFQKAVSILADRRGKIIVTGLGKSAFAGMKIAATATSLGQPAVFMHAVEAMHGDSGIVYDGDVVIAISFSGNTAEVLKTVAHLKRTRDVQVVAITGNKKGGLYASADVAVLLSVKKEGDPLGHAPMASVTASIVAGDMLISAIVTPETFQEKHFANLHPSGALGLRTRKVLEIMSKEIPLVSVSASLKEVLRVMTKGKRGVAGVTAANGKLVGVVTDGDVRRFFMAHESHSGFAARDAMTPHPKTIDHNATLEEALKKMETYKITALFATNGKQEPLGMIKMQQIVEAGMH